MIVPAAIRATPHAHHPPGLWHLVVALPDCRRDLVRDCAGDNHNIGLPGRCAEDDAQLVLVVPRHREVHHFDCAAGEAEAEGPERALSSPVYDLVACCAGGLSVSLKVLRYVERHTGRARQHWCFCE